MASADRFRDSTQIQLPVGTLEGIREELEDRFTVTIRREGEHVRIIGSPVEIKDAGDFLAMNGVTFA
ncbi:MULTISPECIES: hypothetical protein [Haloarcula]|uniref:Uncharacterized protein n=2 Tax=Haloarcula TaxID=2237 RepID=A0A8J7Y5Q0_9EURY|nr:MULTISPECIES: hypothetical protein [Halomicroarcula]MBV0924547.1 hypothetical protein [Halomicroarcula limicola]MBX0294639.1 hypothetical protein [Halomicroarcula nitratireducens]